MVKLANHLSKSIFTNFTKRDKRKNL